VESQMNVTIRTADWSSPRDRVHLEASAGLVYESFRDFYDAVSPSQDAIRDNLVRQLQDGNSELGHSLIITLEETLGGIYVYYPSEDVKARQLTSLRHLLNVATPHPDMAYRLRSFRTAVEAIPMPRYMYLARLGVKSEFRRLGVASMLSSAVEYDCRSRRYEYICGHISRDNSASMRMHLNRGLARISQGNYQFVAVSKHLG
jgi:hypothetical protein